MGQSYRASSAIAISGVINGHSHRQMVRAFPGVSLINAGTLRADHEPCFLHVDFVRANVTVFEFAADGMSLIPPRCVPLV